ncbi:50S ribosomal protein L30 [[Eubacterium] cellulosolvens]
MTYIVVRVRGGINVRKSIKDTLKMLRLNRINHCVIIPETVEYKGMLKKAKDYITWGEADSKLLTELITTRGKLTGDVPITDKYVKANSKYKSLSDFTTEIIKNKAKLTDLKSVKPVIRLQPPRKGYEGIKRPFTLGGALGYRGDKINELVRRMI